MKPMAFLIFTAFLIVVGVLTYKQAHANSTLPPHNQGDDKIAVSDASYGVNCRNDQAGNATDFVKSDCDGKRSCSFPVQHAAGKIGDNCPGTKKDFDWTYVCGDKEKKGHLDGEANGKTAFLTCAN